MSRTGVERKPTWRSMPPAIRAATEELMGSRIARAMRVWGGYSPTPTFRLRLADGRRAFFKGVGPGADEFPRRAHQREERVYRELGDLIAPWAPAYLGSIDRDGWCAMLLEDLGPKSAPPWSPGLTRAVARAYGDFHQSTRGRDLSSWLPGAARMFAGGSREWRLDPADGGYEPLARLAGPRATEARAWLAAAVPRLAEAASRGLIEAPGPHALLHRDTRSDNLRWLDGRLRLFDWPWCGAGPPEYDLAAFAQSVQVEGGPAGEQVVAWYGERAPVRPTVLAASLASLAGFFAAQVVEPDLEGLPRLRPFQRAQLKVTLAWAAGALGLPDPTWLAGVPA